MSLGCPVRTELIVEKHIISEPTTTKNSINRIRIRDYFMINFMQKPYSQILSKTVLVKMSDFQRCLLIPPDIKILSFLSISEK